MALVRQIEWLAHNAQRAYPLATDATRKDLTGSFSLPDDFIVGMSLPVHWGLDILPARFLLHKILASSSGFELTFGYDDNGTIVDVALARVPRATHAVNNEYNVYGLGDFVGSRGYIILGDLGNIDLQPSGSFEFDLFGGRLEVDVIKPNIRGIMSAQAQNGNDLSIPLYGNLVLRAGRNFRITPIIEDDEDPILVLDAIDGIGLSEECVCDESNAGPIKTLQGVGPNAEGNLSLLGNECLEIVPGEHSLTIRDRCSEPCCGCKELEIVTSRLEEFGSQARTLENFIVSLEARVTEMDFTVLGSRLGDKGCVPAADCP